MKSAGGKTFISITLEPNSGLFPCSFYFSPSAFATRWRRIIRKQVNHIAVVISLLQRVLASPWKITLVPFQHCETVYRDMNPGN